MNKKSKKVKKTSTEYKLEKVEEKIRALNKGKDKGHALNKVVSKTGKKRGRPRKVVVEEPKDDLPPIITITYKWIGYCPTCKITIGARHFNGKKFECPSCGTKGKEKNLLKEVKRENNPKNKKEYLEIYYSSFASKEIIPRGAVNPTKPVKVIEDKEEDKEEKEIIDEHESAPLKTDEDNILEDHIDDSIDLDDGK